MRVVERVAGQYETQDLEFGRLYKWHPERVMVECKCGKRSTFKRLEIIDSIPTCECGEDHSARVREELVIEMLEDDEVVRPWRHWRSFEGTSLPF